MGDEYGIRQVASDARKPDPNLRRVEVLAGRRPPADDHLSGRSGECQLGPDHGHENQGEEGCAGGERHPNWQYGDLPLRSPSTIQVTFHVTEVEMTSRRNSTRRAVRIGLSAA